MPLNIQNTAAPRSIDAIMNMAGSKARQAEQPIPDDGSKVFGLALMNLLKQYQTLGTKGFSEQEISARQEQSNRISQSPPSELAGASPSVQSGVREAASQALQPTIAGASQAKQTFSEQLKSFGDVLGTTRNLLKDYEETQNKKRDDARTMIKDAFAIGGADSLNKLPPEELAQLEKISGYPKGYIQGVSQTLKEREVELKRQIAEQNDLTRRLLSEQKRSVPTGAQRQNLAFYNRAQAAVEDAQRVEEEVSGAGTIQQARQRFVPDFFKTQEGKLYSQAQRTFTEARLRKESGAAIPPYEYETDARIYFAQPGDNPTTIAQKRAARKRVLDGLAYSSGPAYEDYFGVPFEGNIIERGGRKFKVLPD